MLRVLPIGIALTPKLIDAMDRYVSERVSSYDGKRWSRSRLAREAIADFLENSLSATRCTTPKEKN